MGPLKGIPQIPTPDFSNQDTPRYRCRECQDRGYVPGRDIGRFGELYSTVKACPDCDLGRGINGRRELDQEERELRRQGKAPSGRRMGRTERMRGLVDPPDAERPTNKRRPSWYEEPEDDEPEIPF